jgi:hypothetical protein
VAAVLVHAACASASDAFAEAHILLSARHPAEKKSEVRVGSNFRLLERKGGGGVVVRTMPSSLATCSSMVGITRGVAACSCPWRCVCECGCGCFASSNGFSAHVFGRDFWKVGKVQKLRTSRSCKVGFALPPHTHSSRPKRTVRRFELREHTHSLTHTHTPHITMAVSDRGKAQSDTPSVFRTSNQDLGDFSLQKNPLV